MRRQARSLAVRSDRRHRLIVQLDGQFIGIADEKEATTGTRVHPQLLDRHTGGGQLVPRRCDVAHGKRDVTQPLRLRGLGRFGAPGMWKSST